jgi:prepilin-type N-terminal cleavage/methylation domain-containing protein
MRRGFTLMELAIVLVVIGSMVALVFSLAGPTKENARVSDALNRVTIVSQNMTSMLQAGYGTNLAAGTNITQAMITTQAIPRWMVTPGTTSPNQTADHLWRNGSFVLSWISSTPRTYRMIFNNVGTLQGCVAFITQATNCAPGQPGCPIIVYTGGVATSVDTRTTYVTSTVVQNLCAANSYTGGVNSVEFDFIN